MPADVLKKLGIGPGSQLQRDEEGGRVVVRRAGRYSSDEVHRALFPRNAAREGSTDVKAGIRKYIRKRRARG